MNFQEFLAVKQALALVEHMNALSEADALELFNSLDEETVEFIEAVLSEVCETKLNEGSGGYRRSQRVGNAAAKDRLKQFFVPTGLLKTGSKDTTHDRLSAMGIHPNSPSGPREYEGIQHRLNKALDTLPRGVVAKYHPVSGEVKFKEGEKDPRWQKKMRADTRQRTRLNNFRNSALATGIANASDRLKHVDPKHPVETNVVGGQLTTLARAHVAAGNPQDKDNIEARRYLSGFVKKGNK